MTGAREPERAAAVAAWALAQHELSARRTSPWTVLHLLLPWPTAWPPPPGGSWARYAFASGSPRTYVPDTDPILVSHAWGRVRHAGSLAGEPAFEPIGDGIELAEKLEIGDGLLEGRERPSIGELLVRACNDRLSPEDEAHVVGTYLADLRQLPFRVPAEASEHEGFLDWLSGEARRPLPRTLYDPADIFLDARSARLEATLRAEEKRWAEHGAAIETELAALKRELDR
jgi:hypothetical protein